MAHIKEIWQTLLKANLSVRILSICIYISLSVVILVTLYYLFVYIIKALMHSER